MSRKRGPYLRLQAREWKIMTSVALHTYRLLIATPDCISWAMACARVLNAHRYPEPIAY